MRGYNGYLCLALTGQSKDRLVNQFGQKYQKLICHHVTVAFNVDEWYNPFPEGVMDHYFNVRVLDRVDSGDGIEAFVVSVYGTSERPDGKTYHITHSLDPKYYKPVDSNKLIEQSTWEDKFDIIVEAKPMFVSFK